MDPLRLIGMCLIAAALVMVLRRMQMQIAGLLCAAVGVMAAGAVLSGFREYADAIRTFLASLQLGGAYYQTLLKAMGVALVTQTAVQICVDMEAPSIARCAEMCGRFALMGVAVPVFMDLTELAVSALR